MNKLPAERERCEVCGRSLSTRGAAIHDGEGCLWCRGGCDE